ncbi:MAG: hypothetical protein ACREQA_02900 [Candidatus Binatia bacterium]
MAIFFNIVLLLIITFPLGFVSGRTVMRLSPAKKIVALTLITTGLLMAGVYKAWACHGTETVGPFLEEVFAAQLDYHERHGVYASSFEELGVAPSSNQYSYFLPADRLLAKNSSPQQGVDLGRLPEGAISNASADKFTVVALAFAEPNWIDVWTIDQDKVFKEWSVPALPKGGIKSSLDQPVATQHTFNGLMNKLEGPLMSITLLLGLGIGFAVSTRAHVTPALASL